MIIVRNDVSVREWVGIHILKCVKEFHFWENFKKF